ncbi:hypothetical protein C0389_01875 [bacterium]|nr:hypothetical protein [bacterium]
MIKPIKKIGLFLIIIIALPIIFFASREVFSLNQDEKVITEIYKSQLESILFSVNQYSEDIVRSWTARIQIAVDEVNTPTTNLYDRLKRLFDENTALNFIFLTDSSQIINIYGKKLITKGNDKAIVSLLQNKSQTIERLNRYKLNNFIKIEPLKSELDNKIQILIFILTDGRVCGLGIEKEIFIRQNLSSKIQSAARNEFTLVVFDSTQNKTVYAVEASSQQKIQQRKNIWLIPEYSLGIALKGNTIENLVKDRTYTNLILILSLSILMLVVAWFGYKNIKREIELAQIKSDFVSNVSHELRTPLALINMFAETLSMGRVKTEEKRNEYCGIIQGEAERLSKIVNKILSFSKLEAEKWKFNFAKTDLNSLTEKIYNSYKFHLQQNGFEFMFEPFLGNLAVNIDSEAVSESIINLIDNAIKYSNEKKCVILRTGRIDKKVFVEIEDSGTGISTEDQTKIFDKFYRASNGNVYNTKGTGLGLTLVKHIIDAHKGEIKLKSKLGEGSVFRLIFPIDQIG